MSSHGNKLKKLNRDRDHRSSLIKNLCMALIKHGQIKTTITKAKVLRPVIEKLVTKAKSDSLASRRALLSYLFHKEDIVSKLLKIGNLMSDRKGGYTRIIKLGVRKGDSATVAMIEFVDKLPEDNKDSNQKDKLSDKASKEAKPKQDAKAESKEKQSAK